MERAGNAGCLCGLVRLQIDGDPIAAVQCHCTDCQKSTGGGAVLVVMLPRTAVTLLQGTLTGYTVIADSGNTVKRCFCPSCGSPAWSELGKYPDRLAVKAGIWDVDPGCLPSAAMFTDSAPGWHHIPTDIPIIPR